MRAESGTQTIAKKKMLKPVSLHFTDAGLEAAYQQHHARNMLQATRFAVVLAASLYIFYGVIDLWIAPGSLPALWSLRAVELLLLAAMFILTFTDFYIRYQQRTGFAIVVLTGLNVCGLFVVMPAEVMNQQIAALVLVIIGGFTLLGLQFLYSVTSGAFLAMCYIALEVLHRDNTVPLAFMNCGYVASAVLLAALGAHTADKHRRLAYFHGVQLERRREASERQSLHDALTGLANRRLLMEKMSHALARDGRFRTMAAVLFIDLDSFKTVNDTRGHAFGDRLLQEVARRLTAAVRATDTVARIGGDEFVVLLEDLRDNAELQTLHTRVLHCFDTACTVEGVMVNVTLSMGCAVHPRDGRTPHRLLDCADQRMYAMKRERGRR